MKTSSSLNFIKRVSILAFACVSLVLAGCSHDVFTKDYSEAREAEAALPKFDHGALKHSDAVWERIAAAVSPSPLNSLLVVMYNELMNPEVFQETLSQSALWSIPVNVLGCRRIFNFNVSGDKAKLADINAEVVTLEEGSGIFFSGVCCDVNQETFNTLCSIYSECHDLVPVIVSDVSGDRFTVAYMFSVREARFHTGADALPLGDRFNAIWQAVETAGHGEEFASSYLDTTFAANGNSITTLLPSNSQNVEAREVVAEARS